MTLHIEKDPMTVHNHGPAEGPGLDCPEYLWPDGRLMGRCILPGNFQAILNSWWSK